MSWRNDLNVLMRSEGGFFGCGAVVVAVVGMSILLLIDWKLAVIFFVAILGIVGVAGLVWAAMRLYKLATRTGGE